MWAEADQYSVSSLHCATRLDKQPAKYKSAHKHWNTRTLQWAQTLLLIFKHADRGDWSKNGDGGIFGNALNRVKGFYSNLTFKKHGKRRKDLYEIKCIYTRMKLFAPLKKQYGAACVVFSTKICHQWLGLMDGRRHCVNGSKSSVYFDSCHISIYLHRSVQSSRQVRIHQHWQQSSGQIEHSGAAGHLVNITLHFTENNSMITVQGTPFCVL